MSRRLFAVPLVLLTLAAHARAQALSPPANFEPRVRAFEEQDRRQMPAPGGVLFVGSSSVERWTSLATDFPQHRVINRGIGGTHVAHAVQFFDRIVRPYAPRLIVMYAGGNDIAAGKPPAAVLGDLKAFVALVFRHLPETRVAFISVAPNPRRWAQVETVREVNRLARAFMESDSRLRFIDVFAAMLGPDGLPKPDIFVEDGLHMNAAGYALWRPIVRPHLDRREVLPSGRGRRPTPPSSGAR